MNFAELDELKAKLDGYRPLPHEVVMNLHEDLIIRWTYNSNAIEGNTRLRTLFGADDPIYAKDLEGHYVRSVIGFCFLNQPFRRCLMSEELFRKAYVDVFSAVTDEKLLILTQEEIPAALGEPQGDPYTVSSFEQLADSRSFLRKTLQTLVPARFRCLLSTGPEGTTLTLEVGGGKEQGGLDNVLARGLFRDEAV